MATTGSSYSRGRTSPEKALQKLKHYCGYQERSHADVKTKLYSLGLFKKEVEALISKLIEEEYLNEERFALHFASGKSRIKGWGRQDTFCTSPERSERFLHWKGAQRVG